MSDWTEVDARLKWGEEAKETLRQIQRIGNSPEGPGVAINHGRADDVLRRLLMALGCEDVVDEYDKIPRGFG